MYKCFWKFRDPPQMEQPPYPVFFLVISISVEIEILYLYQGTDFQKFMVLYRRHQVHLNFLISCLDLILLSWWIEEAMKCRHFTRMLKNYLQGLADISGKAPPPKSLALWAEVGSEQCIFHTFPGDTVAADSGTTFWESCSPI